MRRVEKRGWQRMGEAMERQHSGGFYNVLAEVDLFRDSLAKYGYITHEAREYVLQNLRAAMVEAVSDNRGEVFVHGRKWSEVDGQWQYSDWGYPFLTGLLFSGLHAPHIPEFELERREVEYRQEQLITLARMIVEDKQLPLDGMIVMVSVFPEEYSASQVQELGYRPDDRTAKIRAEVFRSGARMTVELALANSQVEIWNRVWQRNGAPGITNSTELMGSWLWFEGISNEWEMLATLAYEYDRELSRVQGGTVYFLGKEVEAEQEIRDYLDAFSIHINAVEGTGAIVNRLLRVVQELALSADKERVNDVIGSRLDFWLTQPESVISYQERMVIGEARFSGVVTRQLLELIMTKELVMTWSMAAAVINPEKAAAVLGEESVAEVTELLAVLPQRGYFLDSFGLGQWDWWVSIHQQIMLQQFIACGGVVGGVNSWGMDQTSFGWSLYQMPLWEVGLVLGGSDESNYEYSCEHCGYKNKINARMGDLIGKNGRTCKCGKEPVKC